MKVKILKDCRKIKYLYHYTLKENVENILEEKTIKSNDFFTFFTDSYEKSVELFEKEMMSEHLYYDLDGILKKRIPAKKEDYRIIKIPYKNDGKFVKFRFDREDTNSIYSKSIIHEGNLSFKNAKALSIIQDDSDTNYHYSISKKMQYAALTLSFIFSLFIPKKVYADSWLDEGNYDISWTTVPNNSFGGYSFYTPERFAGFNYLTRNNLLTYFNCSYDNPIFLPAEDFDLSEHDWPSLTGQSSCSCICGIHRVILRAGQKLGMGSCGTVRDSLTILYKSVITVASNPNGTITVDKDSIYTGESLTITASTNKPGYYVKSISLDNVNWYTDYSEPKKYKATVSTSSNVRGNKYNLVARAVFDLKKYKLNTEFDDGVYLKNTISEMIYGENYELILETNVGYKITKVLVDGEEYQLSNNKIVLNNVTHDYSIKVETVKNSPKMNNQDQEIILNLPNKKIDYNAIYQLDDYALEYLVQKEYFIVEEPIFNKTIIMKDRHNKNLFQIDPNQKITIFKENSPKDFYFDINEDFRNFFKERSTFDLPENYKRVKVIFTENNNCKKNVELISSRILNSSNEHNRTIFYSEDEVNLDAEFYKKNDSLNIELVIKNDSDFDYKLDLSKLKNEYVDITVDYGNEKNAVLKNSIATIKISFDYVKEIPSNVETLDFLNQKLTTELRLLDKNGNIANVTNPKTGVSSSILMIVLLSVVGISVLLVKEKKSKAFLIVVSILIPSIVSASCNQDIIFNINMYLHNDSLDQQVNFFQEKIDGYCQNGTVPFDEEIQYNGNNILFTMTETNSVMITAKLSIPGVGQKNISCNMVGQGTSIIETMVASNDKSSNGQSSIIINPDSIDSNICQFDELSEETANYYISEIERNALDQLKNILENIDASCYNINGGK